MDNDTTIKLVKAFGHAIAQLIDDVNGIYILLFVLLSMVVSFCVCLPDLIFLGMKKFDRWKKEQEE